MPDAKQTSGKPLIVMQFASLAEYRRRTFGLLRQHFGPALMVRAGDRSPDGTVRVIGVSNDLGIEVIRNVFLPRDVLLQVTSPVALLSAPVVVLDLNPRIPTTWIVLCWRRLTRRPTLLWGHVWPRSGKGGGGGRLRSAMRRLANGIITYTRQQAAELAETGYAGAITAAPNALYFARECGFEANTERTNFIYVGRLVAEKKADLLLAAFELAAPRMPDVGLLIVGDGPQRSELHSKWGLNRGLDIRFLGHISEYDDLRRLYASAVASVSPGYAGLSVTQSFAFGVPMVISRDEPHAPEIEAAVEGVNSWFFDTDNAASLADAMLHAYERRERLAASGAAIASECANSYSVEAMANGLISAIEDQR